MPSNRAGISAERISAGSLILSDSTLKNKIIYLNTRGLASIKCTSIDWLDLIDNSWTRIDVPGPYADVWVAQGMTVNKINLSN